MKSLNNFLVNNSRVLVGEDLDLGFRPLAVASKSDNDKPNKPALLGPTRGAFGSLEIAKLHGGFLQQVETISI